MPWCYIRERYEYEKNGTYDDMTKWYVPLIPGPSYENDTYSIWNMYGYCIFLPYAMLLYSLREHFLWRNKYKEDERGTRWQIACGLTTSMISQRKSQSTRTYWPPVSALCLCSESSPDDVFLLTSAVDNEVKQYLAVDGRLHMDLDVPKTGLEENFTRSYYTSSGRWGKWGVEVSSLGGFCEFSSRW